MPDRPLAIDRGEGPLALEILGLVAGRLRQGAIVQPEFRRRQHAAVEAKRGRHLRRAAKIALHEIVEQGIELRHPRRDRRLPRGPGPGRGRRDGGGESEQTTTIDHGVSFAWALGFGL
jgi:hypothetical protein